MSGNVERVDADGTVIAMAGAPTIARAIAPVRLLVQHVLVQMVQAGPIHISFARVIHESMR